MVPKRQPVTFLKIDVRKLNVYFLKAPLLSSESWDEYLTWLSDMYIYENRS
jgi:hypothetical protein